MGIAFKHQLGVFRAQVGSPALSVGQKKSLIRSKAVDKLLRLLIQQGAQMNAWKLGCSYLRSPLQLALALA